MSKTNTHLESDKHFIRPRNWRPFSWRYRPMFMTPRLPRKSGETKPTVNPRDQRIRYWWLWRIKSCKHKTLLLKLGGGSETCPKMNLIEMLQTNRSSCSQNLQCGCTTAVLQKRFGPKFPIRFMGEMPFSKWCKSPADRRFPLIKYSCSVFQCWEFTCSGWKREVCENAEKVLI